MSLEEQFAVGESVIHAGVRFGLVRKNYGNGRVQVEFETPDDGGDVFDVVLTEELQPRSDEKQIIVSDFEKRAQILIDRGIPTVPVIAGDKRCVVDNWESVATTKAEQIKIWGKQQPSANTAAVAKSQQDGVLFVEFDCIEAIQHFQKETGLKSDKTKTFKVRSRKEGSHGYLCFRHTPESIALANSLNVNPTRKFAGLGDEGEFFSIRAHNRYMVGPGSVVNDGNHPDPYTVIDASPICDVPKEIIEWGMKWKKGVYKNCLAPNQDTDHAPATTTAVPIGDNFDDADSIIALVNSDKVFCKGERNTMTSRYAHLRWRLESCSSEELWTDVRDFNEKRINPPLEEDELQILVNAKMKLEQLPVSTLGGKPLKKRTPPIREAAPVTSVTPVVVEETSSKVLNEEEYRFPSECVEGDRLCDLVHELSDGTIIPPQFVHADLQVWAGHVLDGRICPPKSSYLKFSTRFYLNKFSYHPQSGKGESWERIKWAFKSSLESPLENALPFRPTEALADPGKGYAPLIVNGSEWGSGPFMVSQLAETPNCVCALDEGSIMWVAKAPADQKSLESVFLSLFEGSEHGTGSFKNKKFQASNVHLSLTAGFTLDSFTESYQGRSSGGSGFLSRVLLAFGTRMPTNGQPWPLLESTKARVLAAQISGLMTHPPQLSIETEAIALCVDFKRWLEKQDQYFIPRIAYYMDKDLTLRAAFRDGVVTAEMARRSIRWAQEQLSLRKRFWPIDSATTQGIVELKILGEFDDENAIRSDRHLQRILHIGDRKGKFNSQQYLWARDALVRSGQLEIVGQNRNGKPVYKRRLL